MKNAVKNENEKKITRIPTWIIGGASLLFPPAGVVLLVIDKKGEKKEAEQKAIEDKARDQVIEDIISGKTVVTSIEVSEANTSTEEKVEENEEES